MEHLRSHDFRTWSGHPTDSFAQATKHCRKQLFPMAFTGKRIKDGGRRGEKTKESSSRRQVNAMGCKRVHESIDDSGPWDIGASFRSSMPLGGSESKVRSDLHCNHKKVYYTVKNYKTVSFATIADYPLFRQRCSANISGYRDAKKVWFRSKVRFDLRPWNVISQPSKCNSLLLVKLCRQSMHVSLKSRSYFLLGAAPDRLFSEDSVFYVFMVTTDLHLE